MSGIHEGFRHSVRKTVPPWSALLLGRAPGFVYSKRVTGLPVLVYHDVNEALADDLRFLAGGGYSTVGAAEVEAYLRGNWRPSGRSVVLTFDDGLSSLTRVAVPLLTRFGFRAIAFVVPGLVPATTTDQLAGWNDLLDAVSRKVLDIGSHSLYHHYVPVSSGIVDWVTPTTRVASPTASIPVPRSVGWMQPAPGDPIFRGRARYTTFKAFRPDPEAGERCRALVQQAGPDFFSRPGWRRRLRDVARVTGSWETPAEAEQAIREDIGQSLAIIQERCPNPADRHLCYPYYAGNDRTDGVAKEAGAELVYGGIWKAQRAGDARAPHRMPRLPADFARRLPAPNRRSFPSFVSHMVAATLRL